MKKALSLVMVFLVAVAFSATGYSAEKYISGAVGISWMSETDIEWAFNDNVGYSADFDSGITLAGALGCDYGDYRIEGELGYQSGELDSGEEFEGSWTSDEFPLYGDVSILSLMMNGYYDIDLGGVELSPYAGVGFAQVNGDDISDSENSSNGTSMSESTFAYQLGAVLALPIADNIMLDARYRYFVTTDFTVSVDDEQWNLNMESHSAMIGLRVGI